MCPGGGRGRHALANVLPCREYADPDKDRTYYDEYSVGHFSRSERVRNHPEREGAGGDSHISRREHGAELSGEFGLHVVRSELQHLFKSTS
jgi:hypothetical protein